MSDLSIPLVERAARFSERTAIRDPHGSFRYSRLLADSARAAALLMGDANDLSERRVALLTHPTYEYVVTLWAIWRAGGIAVPLCLAHPEPELDHVIENSGADTLVASPELLARLAPIADRRDLRIVSTDDLTGSSQTSELPTVDPSRGALLIYTSGTTGRPKGALTTHSNIAAQIDSLVEAWEWTAEDSVLLVLPLHHVHGVINVLGCALWSGAECRMMLSFDAGRVWEELSGGELTLFMAVPTVYSKLITAWEECSDDEVRGRWSAGCRQLRLMVSGSAALPVKTLEKWKQISGHTLLERYGMTEIGMALSNPLHGERCAGHVGAPLPGVEVRRVTESGEPADDGTPAELEVRGPTVFREYWANPSATTKAFSDGWFRTGDIAVVENGSYRLLGRNSVDIIKTGGYKVSALEIEEKLREHPDIGECAVVGVPDDEWGERVAAAVVLRLGATLDLEELRHWGRERMATYKLPRLLLLRDKLPTNPLGKVVKPELIKLFSAEARYETR